MHEHDITCCGFVCQHDITIISDYIIIKNFKAPCKNVPYMICAYKMDNNYLSPSGLLSRSLPTSLSPSRPLPPSLSFYLSLSLFFSLSLTLDQSISINLPIYHVSTFFLVYDTTYAIEYTPFKGV